MASFEKTKTGKWRVFVYKAGNRSTKTFNSKMAAKEWAAEKEAEFAAGKSFLSNKTVKDACERYSDEVSPTKGGGKKESIRLKKLCNDPLSEVRLDVLNASHIGEYRDRRLTNVMSSSVNRELNLISAVLTRAQKEWKWLDKNPVVDIKRPKNPPPRNRRISDNEIERICFALGYTEGIPVIMKQQLLAVFFLIAIESGMRLGELCLVFNEHKKNINFEQRIVDIPKTKNGDKRSVPLTKRAVELFKTLYEVDLKLSMESASALFRKATIACDIKDLKFHDSRHEACTRLARKIDVLDLARMIGHRDLKSLMIYYNATASEIAARLD